MIALFTTKTRMFCQKDLLFKFTIGKIGLTIEANDSILVLVVKWYHHANGLWKPALWDNHLFPF